MDGNGVVAPGLGFREPCVDSANVFRHLVYAMSNPGTVYAPDVESIAPTGLNGMACAVALTLCDLDTDVWVQPCQHRESIRCFLEFYAGAPLTDNIQAAKYAFLRSPVDLDVLDSLAVGTDAFPDRSATIIFMVNDFRGGQNIFLEGPGIKTTARLSAAPVDGRFWVWRERMGVLFPLGVDVIFVSDSRLAALPRSTIVSTG